MSDSKEEFEGKYFALSSMRPSVDHSRSNKCINGHLKPKSSHFCIYCEPIQYEHTACYQCEKCRAEREFLRTSDEQFVLVGHERDSVDAELWQCSRCLRFIAFERMSRGPVRDTIHTYGRKIHNKYVCENFRTGVYSM